MVDAADSKSATCEGVGVQVPSPVHFSVGFNLKTAVAGLKMAHLPKIALAFEFSVLTLTVPGLCRRKVQNPVRF